MYDYNGCTCYVAYPNAGYAPYANGYLTKGLFDQCIKLPLNFHICVEMGLAPRVVLSVGEKKSEIASAQLRFLLERSVTLKGSLGMFSADLKLELEKNTKCLNISGRVCQNENCIQVVPGMLQTICLP